MPAQDERKERTLREGKAEVLRHEAVQAIQRQRAHRTLSEEHSYEQEDSYEKGELALACCALLLEDAEGELYSMVAEAAGWPLELAEELGPTEDGKRDTMRERKIRLATAGSLLLAEFERLLRKEKGLSQR